MLLIVPERRGIGVLLLIYAFSVSVATVYGRYHYAADVIAGFGVSLVALVVGLVLQETKRPRASLTA
jgi:membrane-associated phospholipid phosphatase